MPGTDLAKIRSQLPAVEQFAYLNTGTYGPMSRPCADAIQQWTQTELENGRIGPLRSARTGTVKDEARAALAELIGAKPENIALTRNTTEGMNAAVFGQTWREGDEIVTTNVEHGGGLLPCRLAERRFGVVVRQADLKDAHGDVSGRIAPLLTERTRLVALSNVSWSTGAVYDLHELIERCHGRGIAVAVDGAQSAGAIPIDVEALGVDYYAFPGQKWLCGPSGSGGLYVRSTRLETTEPAWIGTAAVSSHGDQENLHLWPSGKRFEGASTANLAALAGLTAGLRWVLDEVGVDWALARNRALAERTIEGLRGLNGVEVVTPADHGPLVCFRVAGKAPSEVVSKLAERKVVARSVNDTGVVRFSTGFYVLEDEIDSAIELVGEIARG